MKVDSSLHFRTGFHAVPSMKYCSSSYSILEMQNALKLMQLCSRQLHLHVISQDFDSKCLKRPKHWNSFTTPFFVDSQEMVDILQRDGQFRGDEYKHYEDQRMVCHKCNAKINSINALKSHMKKCSKWNT